MVGYSCLVLSKRSGSALIAALLTALIPNRWPGTGPSLEFTLLVGAHTAT
jgi:hypothetical protein